MNNTTHSSLIDTSNLAVLETQTPTQMEMSQAPKLGALASARLHWPEYLMEASLLGAFMVSACVFGALYEFPRSPVHQAIMSGFLRRVLMGMSMGLTAVAIIYSPWGKQSGAHINPSVTLTFLRLGKIRGWDALFYIASQFTGAVVGVSLVALVLGKAVSDPAVRYVVTTPGPRGPWVALLAEFPEGFRMLADLGRLESMDIACEEIIGKTMEMLEQHGLELVVRVIPDPSKDIGLKIIGLFHYSKKMRIVTCKTMGEAANVLGL